MEITAATLQFTYADIREALSWYTDLFGRKADFISSEFFQEWEVFTNFWLQIAEGDLKSTPSRLRFGVEDVEKTKQMLETKLNIEITDRFYTEDVVILYNFKDPWGYLLGIFQDLQKNPL